MSGALIAVDGTRLYLLEKPTLLRKWGDPMKILILIRSEPMHRFLVELQSPALVNQVSRLIIRKQHSQAIATALLKGRFQKEVSDFDLPKVKASFILTEESVSWDLMK